MSFETRATHRPGQRQFRAATNSTKDVSKPEEQRRIAEVLRSLDEAIANYTDQGLVPTPHLLMLRAEVLPEVAPDVLPEFEHKAEAPLENAAVPRRPGRPRKPSEQ